MKQLLFFPYFFIVNKDSERFTVSNFKPLQIMESGAIVATGTVQIDQDLRENLQLTWDNSKIISNPFPVQEEDIYQILRIKGYHTK